MCDANDSPNILMQNQSAIKKSFLPSPCTVQTEGKLTSCWATTPNIKFEFKGARTHTHTPPSCYTKGIALGLLRAGHTHLQTASHSEICGGLLMSKQSDKFLQKGKVVKTEKGGQARA